MGSTKTRLTALQRARRTWSLVEGCSPVSAGCQHCWSAQQTYMRSHQKNPKIKARYEGLNKDKTTFNGKIRLMDENLDLPLRTRKPTVWAVWNDLFHKDVPDSFLRQVFWVMRMHDSDKHIFVILTKRPKRLAGFVNSLESYPNIWPGVSVEDQKTADERICELLKVSASVIVVSYEPALGSLVLPPEFLERGKRSWTIAGGETGPGARPMNPEWARQVQRQCAAAGVPYFFKSWGWWTPCHYWDCGYWLTENDRDGEVFLGKNPTNLKYTGGHTFAHVTKKQAGRLLDGREWNQTPA